jgi:hypothetical protein
MVVVGLTGDAWANIPPSTFGGGDGNLVAPDANGLTDWLTPPPNFATSLDLASGQTDNSFGNGTKEDNVNVTVGLGSIPNNKADLRRQLIGEEVINGDLFVYLGATRASISGTVNYDFEINQKVQPNLTTAGAKTLNRTVGDVLITYDFSVALTSPLDIHSWTALQRPALNSTKSVNRGHPGQGSPVTAATSRSPSPRRRSTCQGHRHPVRQLRGFASSTTRGHRVPSTQRRRTSSPRRTSRSTTAAASRSRS